MPEKSKPKKEGTAAEDQKDHKYYYDDAHGYEKYEPASDEDSEDEEGEESDDGSTPHRLP